MDLIMGDDGKFREYKPYKEISFETKEDFEEFERRMKKGDAMKPVLKHDVGRMHINRGNKPHEWRTIESDNWHCPVCDGFVGEHEIDWSDEE